MADFIFFLPLCISLFCFTRRRAHKARDLVSELKTPFRCRLFVLFLCHSSVRSLSPPPRRLALCLPCDVCPSPTGLYPLCAPKGLRACCCSLKRLGEKFGATLQREEKLQPLGRRGTTWSMRRSVVGFFFSSSEFSHEKNCWTLTLMHVGGWVDVQVA